MRTVSLHDVSELVVPDRLGQIYLCVVVPDWRRAAIRLANDHQDVIGSTIIKTLYMHFLYPNLRIGI